MKRAISVKSAPVPGFSKRSGSACGKGTLDFFGLMESVSFFVVSSFINIDFFLFNIYSGMR